MLMSLLPQAAEIAVRVTSDVEWIDPGANFERVVCPRCEKELDLEWWKQEVDSTYQQTHFVELVIEMPCCHIICSLNDLQYEWPAGFAQFVIEVWDPAFDLDVQQMRQLEQIVQSPLRKIWTHL
jgi:hypothetical protein